MNGLQQGSNGEFAAMTPPGMLVEMPFVRQNDRCSTLKITALDSDAEQRPIGRVGCCQREVKYESQDRDD
jgi:hypothetical protein